MKEFWSEKVGESIEPSKTVGGEIVKTVFEMYLATVEVAGLAVANAALYLIERKSKS